MKILLTFCLLQVLFFGSHISIYAQNEQDSIYTYVDEGAEPVIGMTNFLKSIGKNLVMPKSARQTAVYGSKVYVQFIVEKDGSTSQVKIFREGALPEHDEAVLKAVK